MSKYKLIYFNVTGIAEPIRYLFAYGRIPFEDKRLEYDEWLTYKASTPFGQIPVLEIDGKTYNQATAICRHLAKRLDLVGKNDWDAFQADVIVDTITDFRLNYASYFKIQSVTERLKKLEEIKTIHNPYYLEKFDKIVQENGGYFVNHRSKVTAVLVTLLLQFPEHRKMLIFCVKITSAPFVSPDNTGQATALLEQCFVNPLSWADIYFAALSDLWTKVSGHQILADYSHLHNLKQKIDDEPKIKAYRESRPETLY